MGVSLALKKLESALADKPGARIRTLGPIIHNPQALADFESKGVICINSPDEARPHDHVLIRAHGVPREVENHLKLVCASVEDATCPKVKKAQLAIADATSGGATLLLFGEADHPEVAGLISYAAGPACVFGSPLELQGLRYESHAGLVLASQTTQDRGAFERIASWLLARHRDLNVLHTICDATRFRQEEALDIAHMVDVMIVIGGRSSGNTRRLASLASESGIETFHVETIAELTAADLAGKSLAGLTAGASTPEHLIDDAEKWLSSL